MTDRKTIIRDYAPDDDFSVLYRFHGPDAAGVECVEARIVIIVSQPGAEVVRTGLGFDRDREAAAETALREACCLAWPGIVEDGPVDASEAADVEERIDAADAETLRGMLEHYGRQAFGREAWEARYRDLTYKRLPDDGVTLGDVRALVRRVRAFALLPAEEREKKMERS